MMAIGYSTYIWVPLLLYPTVEAPQWKKGWPSGIAFTSALFGLFVLAIVLHNREYVTFPHSLPEEQDLLTSYSLRRKAAHGSLSDSDHGDESLTYTEGLEIKTADNRVVAL